MSEPVTQTLLGDRRALHEVVPRLVSVDEWEAADRADALGWIASGAEPYRRVPPAEPPKHLVVYFLPCHSGTDSVFLVEHRKAGLLLPPGGHVEPGEEPRDTIVRDAREEFGVVARPHQLAADQRLLFLTVTPTVGPYSHVDATLWWLLDLDPAEQLTPDPGEFTSWGWLVITEPTSPNRICHPDSLNPTPAMTATIDRHVTQPGQRFRSQLPHTPFR